MDSLIVDPEFKALIPPLQPEERDGLEQSILAEGCRDPIVIHNGVIVDGHNRYEICQKHNIAFKTILFPQLEPTRDDLKIWIITNQFSRRNLSAYQRTVLALALKPLIAAKAKEKQEREGRSLGGTLSQKSVEGAIDTQKELAKIAGVSHDTIAKVEKIEKETIPEVRERIGLKDTGYQGFSINEAYSLSREPPERQKQIVDKIVNSEAKGIQDAKRIIASEQIKDTPVVQGKYKVVYADPPWQYGGSMNETYGTADKHYPTMSLEDICAMPIPDIIEDNAVLFLWTTSPLLEDSFKVIAAWGFRYKASFVWDKVKHVMGHYNSVRHEFLLVATRGSCIPENMKLFDSVVSEERTDHSCKPETFRGIINTLYPSGNRIELFAREKVEGWESYGNQL